jgi:hypothetical protein
MPLYVDKLNVNGNEITGKAPYKVYTALLTQSGGSNISTTGNINGGPNKDVDGFDIGVTYEITANPNNTNLTKYGATSNSVGTKFVSNYSGNLTDDDIDVDVIFSFNTGAPVVTVLENTIGNIWFTYSQIGQYLINFSETFFGEKMYAQGSFYTEDGTGFRVTTIIPPGPTFFNLLITTTYPISEASSNDILYNTPIEIRVYN